MEGFFNKPLIWNVHWQDLIMILYKVLGFQNTSLTHNKTTLTREGFPDHFEWWLWSCALNTSVDPQDMSQVNHITEPGKKRRGDGAGVSAFTRVSLRIDCVDVLLSQIKIQYASPVQTLQWHRRTCCTVFCVAWDIFCTNPKIVTMFRSVVSTLFKNEEPVSGGL